MIMQCNCKHPFQDEKYGKGNRVHNQLKNGQFRCTVCLDKKGNPGKVETTKDKK